LQSVACSQCVALFAEEGDSEGSVLDDKVMCRRLSGDLWGSNITAGNRAQIQSVIDANVFPLLSNKLANAEFDVKKEAAWAIANATSGNKKFP
jgi:hypothetical protein